MKVERVISEWQLFDYMAEHMPPALECIDIGTSYGCDLIIAPVLATKHWWSPTHGDAIARFLSANKIVIYDPKWYQDIVTAIEGYERAYGTEVTLRIFEKVE